MYLEVLGFEFVICLPHFFLFCICMFRCTSYSIVSVTSVSILVLAFLNTSVVGYFFSFQIMTVFLSIPVLCELTALTCLMNSTVTLHSQAFSPRTTWGMQLDCHLIMSVRKYSTLTSSKGASIQCTSMVLATLPLLKVSMCCLCKSSNTTLCVYMCVCAYIHTHTSISTFWVVLFTH